MNHKRWIAVPFACLAIACLFPTHSVFAQTRIAIVDIGEVFKGHPQFSQQLEQLKQEADAFKAQSIQAQQTLVQKAEMLKQYTPGSPDYNNAEAGLAQQAAAMELDQKNQMRKLMEREASLHYETYQQVNAAIAKFCDTQGIQLVLRFDSQKMDPKNPGTVMQQVNSSVVFHAPTSDITRIIIGQLGGQPVTANNGTTLPR